MMPLHTFDNFAKKTRLAGALPGRCINRSRCAFSLIELLVVISIISLLVSILLPSLKNAREAARGVTCLSNMRQLALGMTIYTEDFGGQFPKAWTNSPWRDWSTDLADYLPENAAKVCPSCDRAGERHYGFNHWLASNQGRYRSDIDYPTRMCIFADIAGDVDRSYAWNYNNDMRFNPDPRHAGNGVNLVFADGHGEPFREARDLDGFYVKSPWNLSGTHWLPTAGDP